MSEMEGLNKKGKRKNMLGRRAAKSKVQAKCSPRLERSKLALNLDIKAKPVLTPCQAPPPPAQHCATGALA